jgi:hypothetical protein
VIGEHDQAPGRGHHGAVDVRLHEVRRGESGLHVHPVHAEEQGVHVQAAHHLDRDGADQRVGRGAQAAGEKHRLRPVAVDVQVVGYPDTVGDHGKARDPGEVDGRSVRRRARTDRDRGAGFNQRCRHGADLVLRGQLTVRLRLEARLVTRAPRGGRRTAVHLLDQALAGERVDIPAHRHLGNAEQFG